MFTPRLLSRSLAVLVIMLLLTASLALGSGPAATNRNTAVTVDYLQAEHQIPNFSSPAQPAKAAFMRTCRCSCGYPCKTNADCGAGGVCSAGITCCAKDPKTGAPASVACQAAPAGR